MIGNRQLFTKIENYLKPFKVKQIKEIPSIVAKIVFLLLKLEIANLNLKFEMGFFKRSKKTLGALGGLVGLGYEKRP
jgi:hypothetical protein